MVYLILPITVWISSLIIAWAHLRQGQGLKGFFISLLPELGCGVLVGAVVATVSIDGAVAVLVIVTIGLSVPYSILMIGLVPAYRFSAECEAHCSGLLRVLATGPWLWLALIVSTGLGAFLNDYGRELNVHGALVAWRPVQDAEEIPWQVSAQAMAQDQPAQGWCAEEFWAPAPPGKAVVSGRAIDCETNWRSEVRLATLEDGSRWVWTHTSTRSFGSDFERAVADFVAALVGFDVGGIVLYGISRLARRATTGGVSAQPLVS